MSNDRRSEFGQQLFDMMMDINSMLYGSRAVVLPTQKPALPQKPVITTFPPFERTGSYTADDLAALEANHLRLIEAAASAMAYVNPHLYVYGALKRAITQAEELRKKVGLK